MAGTFFGTQTASLTKIQVEFVFTGCRGYLNGVVRTIHIAIAAIETKAATEATLGFLDNIFAVKRRINLSEILEPRMDRDGFFAESFFLFIIVSIQILGVDHRWL